MITCFLFESAAWTFFVAARSILRRLRLGCFLVESPNPSLFYGANDADLIAAFRKPGREDAARGNAADPVQLFSWVECLLSTTWIS